MAKFNGSVVVIKEINLPAIFYMRYLLRYENSEIQAPPVMYYDSINKKGIDEFFANLTPIKKFIVFSNINQELNNIRKSVNYSCSVTTVKEGIRNEGEATKLQKELQKMIKEHTYPYNDIYYKYSVQVYNG